MHVTRGIVDTIAALLGNPEWMPHDHTPWGRNVPRGFGLESRRSYGVPEWMPHDHTPWGGNVPFGAGVETAMAGPWRLGMNPYGISHPYAYQPFGWGGHVTRVQRHSHHHHGGHHH